MRQSMAFWAAMMMATVSGTALAQRVESFPIEDAKGWTGVRSFDSDGKLARCAASLTPPGGGLLTLAQDRDRSLFLAVNHPKWTLDFGGTSTIRVGVDKGRGAPEAVPVVAGQGAVLDITQNATLTQGLRAGRALSVTAGAITASFPLIGATKTLAALADCVDAALTAEAAAAKTPAPAAAAPAPEAPAAVPAPVTPAPAPTPAPEAPAAVSAPVTPAPAPTPAPEAPAAVPAPAESRPRADARP